MNEDLIKTGKSRWLLLPIEMKVREFDAKILLGCLAAERGYSVLVGHYGVINRWNACLPRGIILEKNISVRYRKQLSKLHSSGYKICVNDEESLALILDHGSWFRIRMSREMVGLVEYVFAWSGYLAEFIQKEYPEYANKIQASGTPRVDILRREFRDLYGREVQDLKRRFGKFILLPSNFAAVINVKGDDSTLQRRLRHGYIQTKEEEELYRENLGHERDTLDRYVRSFKRIRTEFPDHALVIRPHPIDDCGFWENAIEDIDNAHVVHEGNITPWLLAADAVFHCGCSTGMEARIMERCSIAYHPLYDERFDTQHSTEIGPVAYNEDELILLMHKAVNNSGECILDHKDVDKFICSLDGKLASEKMLDAIDTIIMPEDALNHTWSNLSSIKVRVHEAYRRWRRDLKLRLGGDAEAVARKAKRSQQKWPGASLSEVQALIKEFNNITGRFDQIEAKQVTGDLFCISNKNFF